MQRPAALLLLVCGVAAPSAAQDARVQVDEFTVAGQTAGTPPGVDQVGSEAAPVVADEQDPDRAIATGQASARQPVPVQQLSVAGQPSRPEQLSDPGAPSTQVASVSDKAESRPQALQRLAGNDRCDPQLPQAQREDCRTILERRAAEFSAPRPPELSAEQILLAEQQTGDGDGAGLTGDMRVRLASLSQGNAELRSNQELAAIVLDPPQPPVAPTTPEPSESLAEALRGLAIDLGAGSPPTP